MSELAILGGKKTVEKDLAQLSAKIVPEEAYDIIKGMLDRGEISMSPKVGEFEKNFAEYIGVKYGLCVCNGTTSIQAGLFAVGVGAGDEVIVPSYTFWATVGPVVANGAIPVFADVDEDTHNLTAKTIEKCITKKTKAILLVHVWGNPCDMDDILALAKKYNLKIVEDCSHAHGAVYKGKKVGSIGDVGCFSMQGSKILPAGEGGILVTDSKEYLDRATALGHYEKCSKLGEDSEYSKYMLTGFGYKHRINPIAAVIADANLSRLDYYNKIRNDNAKRLEGLMSDIDFVKFQKVVDGAEKVYSYHYAEYLPEKFGNLKLTTLLIALAKEGVVCGSCGYGKLHLSPLYKKEGPFANEFPFNTEAYDGRFILGELPVTTKLASATFMAAPRFETATLKDIEQYAEAYHKIARNLDELLEYEKKNNVQDSMVNDGRSINYVKV